MNVKARIVKLAKIKQPKEKLRQITKTYFDGLTNADLERMRDNPETVPAEFAAEFSRMWDIRYRVMTETERAEIDTLRKELTHETKSTLESHSESR